MSWAEFPPTLNDKTLQNAIKTGANALLKLPEAVQTLIPYMDAWQLMYEVLDELLDALPHQPPMHRRPVKGFIKALGSGANVAVPIGEVGYDAKTKQILIKVNKEGGGTGADVFFPVSLAIPLIIRLLAMLPFDVQQEIGTAVNKQTGETELPSNRDMVQMMFDRIRMEVLKKDVVLPKMDGSYSSGKTGFSVLPTLSDFLLYNVPAMEYCQAIYDSAKEIVDKIPHHPPPMAIPVYTGGVKVSVMFKVVGGISQEVVYFADKVPPTTTLYGNDLFILLYYYDKDGLLGRKELYHKNFNTTTGIYVCTETIASGENDETITEGDLVCIGGFSDGLIGKVIKHLQGKTIEETHQTGVDDEGNPTYTTIEKKEENIVYVEVTAGRKKDGFVFPLPVFSFTQDDKIQHCLLGQIRVSSYTNAPANITVGTVVETGLAGVQAYVYSGKLDGDDVINPVPTLGKTGGKRALYDVIFINETDTDIVIPDILEEQGVLVAGTQFLLSDGLVGKTIKKQGKAYMADKINGSDENYPNSNFADIGLPLEKFEVDYATPLRANSTLVTWHKELKYILEELSLNLPDLGVVSTNDLIKRYCFVRIKMKYLNRAEEVIITDPVTMPHGEVNLVDIHYNAKERRISVVTKEGGTATMKTSSCVWFLLALLAMIPISSN